MNRRVLYPAGMFVIILACFTLLVISLRLPAPLLSFADSGIVFPSPESFNISRGWGSAINIILLFGGGLALYLLNKHFSLLRTGQPLGASFLLPLCFSTLPITQHLSSAPFLLLLTILILSILFDSFRSQNATRSIFVAATILSVGSMFQIAFIPLIAATFLCALVMKALRFKEFMALGLGLVAPYWVTIGLGLVNPLSFHFPTPHTIFQGGVSPATFVTLIAVGVLAVTTSILSAYNAIILYAGNSRVRRSIISINIFGITALVAMLLDINNIPAYIGIFYLWVATQFANLFSLRSMRRGMLTFWLIQTAIMAFSLFYIL